VTGSIDPFLSVLVAIIGLCFGSFATAISYRIPRNIPWIVDKTTPDNKASRSQCASCGATLTVLDLIPVFSWLFSKGKCRYCHRAVSSRYPLTELATLVLVLAQFWSWGITLGVIPVLIAVPFLVAAVLIDWDFLILPNDTNIALTVLSILFVGLLWFQGNRDLSLVLDHVLAGMLLTFVFWAVSFVISKWKGREALGQGDLKFLPAAGLFLGISALPSFLALSGILGLLTAIPKRKTSEKGAFPFGPALIVSLYIHVFLTGLGFDYKW
jgi:leader peptidase (prepilin peptidase)/N-methyltransferase